MYELGGRSGYSYIFALGRFGGFNPREVDMMLHVSGTVCLAVTGYQFKNVTRLARDFQAGYFAPAFPLVTHRPPSDRRNERRPTFYLSSG